MLGLMLVLLLGLLLGLDDGLLGMAGELGELLLVIILGVRLNDLLGLLLPWSLLLGLLLLGLLLDLGNSLLLQSISKGSVDLLRSHLIMGRIVGLWLQLLGRSGVDLLRSSNLLLLLGLLVLTVVGLPRRTPLSVSEVLHLLPDLLSADQDPRRDRMDIIVDAADLKDRVHHDGDPLHCGDEVAVLEVNVLRLLSLRAVLPVRDDLVEASRGDTHVVRHVLREQKTEVDQKMMDPRIVEDTGVVIRVDLGVLPQEGDILLLVIPHGRPVREEREVGILLSTSLELRVEDIEVRSLAWLIEGLRQVLLVLGGDVVLHLVAIDPALDAVEGDVEVHATDRKLLVIDALATSAVLLLLLLLETVGLDVRLSSEVEELLLLEVSDEVLDDLDALILVLSDEVQLSVSLVSDLVELLPDLIGLALSEELELGDDTIDGSIKVLEDLLKRVSIQKRERVPVLDLRILSGRISVGNSRRHDRY